jgi:hypothetical protein
VSSLCGSEDFSSSPMAFHRSNLAPRQRRLCYAASLQQNR